MTLDRFIEPFLSTADGANSTWAPITGQVETFDRGGPCRLGRKFPTQRLTGNIVVPSEKP